MRLQAIRKVRVSERDWIGMAVAGCAPQRYDSNKVTTTIIAGHVMATRTSLLVRASECSAVTGTSYHEGYPYSLHFRVSHIA